MKKFAVFDFDGTLIRWQLYHSVVSSLVKKDQIDKNLFTKAEKALQNWKSRSSSNAFTKYQVASVNAFKSNIKSISTKKFDESIEEIFLVHKDQVYVYTKNLIKELKAKDYFLIAISGSHIEAVERIARYYGFNEWTGTRYKRKSGKFTSEFDYPGKSKGRFLENFIKKHGLTKEDSIAIGDSEGDIEILDMVENPIAFNPTKGLLSHAQNLRWKIIVERKSVVYSLTYKDGRYVLSE